MRLKLICAVLVGVLLIVPGCGSKKKSTATKTTTPTTTTSASGGTNLTASDCANLVAAGQTVSQVTTGTVPSDINTQIARLNELAKNAPAAVRSDFAVLAEAAGQFAKLGVKPGQKATPAQKAQLLASVDLVKVSAAITHLGTWARANCTS